MAIKAPTGRKYPQPSDGVVSGVAIDVVELGLVETTFDGEKKKKPMVRVVFEIDEENPETGKPFQVNKRYTLSMHEKAALRKDIESWRSRKFASDEEAADFDLERLIGQPALLNMQKNEKSGKTFTNIVTVSPLVKGMAPLKAASGYVRVKDRPGYVPPSYEEAPEDVDQSAGTEDDIPF